MEDYEKKYKEALEKANSAYKDEDRHLKATLGKIFPELKESEDEKIRKDIIAFIKENYSSAKRWIAWLEKQKPVELAKDDLSTLENWIGYIQDKSSELELNDWFVEATEKVVNKMKILLVQYPNMMPKEMDEDDKNFWLEKQGEQKPAEWNEEDEKMVDKILTPLAIKYPLDIYQPMYNWLKSLKQRIGG